MCSYCSFLILSITFGLRALLGGPLAYSFTCVPEIQMKWIYTFTHRLPVPDSYLTFLLSSPTSCFTYRILAPRPMPDPFPFLHHLVIGPSRTGEDPDSFLMTWNYWRPSFPSGYCVYSLRFSTARGERLTVQVSALRAERLVGLSLDEEYLGTAADCGGRVCREATRARRAQIREEGQYMFLGHFSSSGTIFNILVLG